MRLPQFSGIPRPAAITAPVAKALREGSGLTCRAFWAVVGVKHDTATNYERGVSRIPESVQKLLFMHYIAGIPVDAEPQQWRDIGHLIALHGEALAELRGKVVRQLADLVPEEAE